MVIPPPNVTGSLHLGHALTNAIQVGGRDAASWRLPTSVCLLLQRASTLHLGIAPGPGVECKPSEGSRHMKAGKRLNQHQDWDTERWETSGTCPSGRAAVLELLTPITPPCLPVRRTPS